MLTKSVFPSGVDEASVTTESDQPSQFTESGPVTQVLLSRVDVASFPCCVNQSSQFSRVGSTNQSNQSLKSSRPTNQSLESGQPTSQTTSSEGRLVVGPGGRPFRSSLLTSRPHASWHIKNSGRRLPHLSSQGGRGQLPRVVMVATVHTTRTWCLGRYFKFPAQQTSSDREAVLILWGRDGC